MFDAEAPAPEQTRKACEVLGIALPDLKGATQAEVDAKLEAFRAKGGPLQTALKAHRKQWHPDRCQEAEKKEAFHERFTLGEQAADYLMNIRILVRSRGPGPGMWQDGWVPPRPPPWHEYRHAQERQPPPPKPKKKRGKVKVAQAKARPRTPQEAAAEVNAAPTTPDGRPLGVPRTWAAQQQQIIDAVRKNVSFRPGAVAVDLGVGQPVVIDVDIGAMLNGVFASILGGGPVVVEVPRKKSRGRSRKRHPLD